MDKHLFKMYIHVILTIDYWFIFCSIPQNLNEMTQLHAVEGDSNFIEETEVTIIAYKAHRFVSNLQVMKYFIIYFPLIYILN